MRHQTATGPDVTGAAGEQAEAGGAADGDRPGPPSLFVEVDTTGQPGRGGCAPAQVPGVVAGLREMGCRVEGLMTVAPVGEARLARAAFDQVARLGGELD